MALCSQYIRVLNYAQLFMAQHINYLFVPTMDWGDKGVQTYKV